MHVAAAHVTPAPIEREEMLADFVAEHYQRLFRLAMLICRDPAEASDAVQHGLERAWRKRAALRDDASIRSWLDWIIVNEAIRQSRRRQSWRGRLMPPRASVEWIEPVDERAQELPAWTALRASRSRQTTAIRTRYDVLRTTMQRRREPDASTSGCTRSAT